MDSENAAMAHKDPDAGAGKELGAVVSGDPAVPANENPNEQLITRPYVRGVDFWRDSWRNFLAIILTLLLTLQGYSIFTLILLFFNESAIESNVIGAIPHSAIISGYLVVAVALFTLLIVVYRRRRQQPLTRNKTVKPSWKTLGALLKLFAALTSSLFLLAEPSWADIIAGSWFPPAFAKAIGFLLISVVFFSAAAVDAHLAAVDPVERLKEESLRTANTIRALEEGLSH